MKMSGNTVLITGGGSGIGFEFAKQLLQRGNKVIITGRSSKKLETAKKLLPQLETLVNDVANPADIEALYQKITKEYSNVNIVINNAGIMKELNIHTDASSLQQLTEEIEINLMGPIRVSKLFLPHLKSKPAAAIVNVSSGLAFTPLPTSPVYCATKAGLHSFCLSLRVQLQKTNVKVFEVAPPATQTELLRDFNAEDMKNITIMKLEDMVTAALKGMEQDKYEIRPGQSNQLKFMSRVAPDFILKQMSAPVERMLRGV